MNLEELRNEINGIDEAIVELLDRRAATAGEIGRIKAAAGLPVFDRRREADVMRRVTHASSGDFGDSAMARIFAEIMLESRRLQRTVTVAGRQQLEEAK
ncbi:MAG TPA: chorismate mutase [Pyrinomonadaceae bacterium]|jgi:chorismate mutase|nr:chorismate mutase [Pyrinomonadaceae bacterium]